MAYEVLKAAFIKSSRSKALFKVSQLWWFCSISKTL